MLTSYHISTNQFRKICINYPHGIYSRCINLFTTPEIVMIISKLVKLVLCLFVLSNYLLSSFFDTIWLQVKIWWVSPTAPRSDVSYAQEPEPVEIRVSWIGNGTGICAYSGSRGINLGEDPHCCSPWPAGDAECVNHYSWSIQLQLGESLYCNNTGSSCQQATNPTPFLEVKKNWPPNVLSWQLFTYTITTYNYGSGLATWLSISDTLPPEFVYVSSSTGVFSWLTNTLDYGEFTLAAHSSYTISILGYFNVAWDDLKNKVTLTAPPQYSGINCSYAPKLECEDGVLTDVTDLSFTKTVNTWSAIVWVTNVSYQIEVTNNGPVAVEWMVIDPIISGCFTMVTGSATTGFFDSGTNIWTFTAEPSPAVVRLNIQGFINTGSVDWQVCTNIAFLSGTSQMSQASVIWYSGEHGACGWLSGSNLYNFSNNGTLLTGGSTGLCSGGVLSGFSFNPSNHRREWACDGTNGGTSMSCSAQESYCGDGTTGNSAGAEECDDGNTINQDGCNNNCTISSWWRDSLPSWNCSYTYTQIADFWLYSIYYGSPTATGSLHLPGYSGLLLWAYHLFIDSLPLESDLQTIHSNSSVTNTADESPVTITLTGLANGGMWVQVTSTEFIPAWTTIQAMTMSCLPTTWMCNNSINNQIYYTGNLPTTGSLCSSGILSGLI